MEQVGGKREVLQMWKNTSRELMLKNVEIGLEPTQSTGWMGGRGLENWEKGKVADNRL